MYHISVLVREVVAYLAPKKGGIYVDATFGGGGHTRAILDAEPTAQVIALDWDKGAIEKNGDALKAIYGDRLRLIWGNFAQLYMILRKAKIKGIDGILADFGTSQYQIHEKAGFSFRTDTPLDMRMSPAHQSKTAAYILNTACERELASMLFEYGQEQQSRKIARAIVLARVKEPFVTTGQLVSLIETIIPVASFKHRRGIHPATQTFQALRIVVNSELENIKLFLNTALSSLNDHGRIVCISFHSLEDRLVKTFFREHREQLEILTAKPVEAAVDELARNPSSRSAKLRAAQKREYTQ